MCPWTPWILNSLYEQFNVNFSGQGNITLWELKSPSLEQDNLVRIQLHCLDRKRNGFIHLFNKHLCARHSTRHLGCTNEQNRDSCVCGAHPFLIAWQTLVSGKRETSWQRMRHFACCSAQCPGVRAQMKRRESAINFRTPVLFICIQLAGLHVILCLKINAFLFFSSNLSPINWSVTQLLTLFYPWKN